jgi:hypothetical protein
MIEFTRPEPVELTFWFHFPPNRSGVAVLHDTGCTAGAAGGRWRSENWSSLTWDSIEAALAWAGERHFAVERCPKCFARAS